MKSFARVVAWFGVLIGGALFVWKGWDGMIHFLLPLVVSTLEEGQEIPKFLPGYLPAVLGIALISLGQVGSACALGPRFKMMGILRGLLLLASAGVFLSSISKVIGMFQSLAASGTADPSSLETSLLNVSPSFHIALGLLLLSSLLGALGTLDKTSATRGIAMKVLEAVAWAVSTLIAISLLLSFLSIDSMLGSVMTGGSADPSNLAGSISAILHGLLAWSGSLALPGLLAIIGSAQTKPKGSTPE